ncbi:MAG TPA: translation elongation factor Ts, partial [Polyangiaceae bacterium]|nr:translation elongation factor Ts [Polyangiaceae bacterium]
SQIDMKQVKELRDRTQAGINDCRSALVETSGDMEKAVEVILKKGLAKSAKRAGAIATEGVVAAAVAADGKMGVLVEVNIQTDFAARNADFLKFADGVVAAALKAKTGADLGAETFPGGSDTIEATRQALVGKLGENITVRRWDRVSLDGPGKVHSYVHLGGKVGVVLGVRAGTDAAAKSPAFEKFADDTSMQVAAMGPIFVSASEIPDDMKKKQTAIYEAQLVEEGKPEKARPKIIEGKLAKWAKEVCLLEQASVLEADHSVEQIRAALAKELGADIALVRFVRFQLGEGVEKPTGEDFAAEVAKMAGA